MSEEELIEILNSIVWYNGLYEPLYNLKKDIEYEKKCSYTKYNHKLELKHEHFDDRQFEIFWMILVLKYGEYGTSPRSGWLLMENKKEIIKFIDDITKYDRLESGDNNE